MKKPYMKIEEISKTHDIPRHKLYYWLYRGYISETKKIGAIRYFDDSAIKNILEYARIEEN